MRADRSGANRTHRICCREREERPRRDNGGDNFENRNKGGRQQGGKPGPRGPRRNFDDRRGKREFDRQSGSDKT